MSILSGRDEVTRRLHGVRTMTRDLRGGTTISTDAVWRRARPFDPASCRISVILPLRNEARHVERTLESVLSQSFPLERTEIILVDGMSEDGTRDILHRYRLAHANIQVLDNPSRTTPQALNIALAASTGDPIVRVDGHCEIAPDYIQRCVELLARSGAANVGGRLRPRGTNAVGRAVAIALGTPVGVGGGRFHYLERQEYVDTVYLGAFRREVLEEVGVFDERFTRNQDTELNFRIREAGFGILLSPDIISWYTPRDSLPRLWRQLYRDGFWRTRIIEKHPGSIEPRHLAPPFLVVELAASILTFALLRRRWLLLPVVGYTGGISAAAAWKARREPRLIPVLATVFACLHLGYGVGFLASLLGDTVDTLKDGDHGIGREDLQNQSLPPPASSDPAADEPASSPGRAYAAGGELGA